MDMLAHEKEVYEYKKTIDHLKKQNAGNSLFKQEIGRLENKLEQLKKTVYKDLSPWERVQISRHPGRPHTVDYIDEICDSFIELSGDRTYGEDASVVGGLAMVGDERCMIIGQEKGNDTDSRMKRNFGMVNPEGFRKALRLMQLAEKFKLPVLSLLDTPGAYPGLGAEERGQGWVIANNIMKMSRIQTPIVVVVIGEGCSGGALGMGVGDTVAMLEHSYYTVISPEGCASILWKDAGKNKEASNALKLNAENLIEFEIVDHVIKEPLGGAHHNPKETCNLVKQFFLEQISTLKHMPVDLLIEQRYLKFRKIGAYDTTP
ncbi:acetyl-CoA carboxylase carboxyltransferase subunit alpha [Chlamydiales bacterium]|nr:acetyl-CoA carboxylase carboxyltransferase subunit alpha [Chlamydiales bacterium]